MPLNEDKRGLQNRPTPWIMQKLIAILILGLLIAAALLVETSPESASEPVSATNEQNVVEDVVVEEKPVEKPSEPLIDPQGCEPEQYWAKEYPHDCIDKPKPAPKPAAIVPSGDWVARCHRWAEMAGMTLPDAAITLIGRESKCNPTVRNPDSSAGGIPQALPWTKMECGLSWDDSVAVCQLKWMKSYVDSRYGSWEAALQHSYSHNWY